jgi:hypothetical protein
VVIIYWKKGFFFFTINQIKTFNIENLPKFYRKLAKLVQFTLEKNEIPQKIHNVFVKKLKKFRPK